MNTKTRLSEHFRAYPELQAEDIFKYLFQSAFGCEHLVSNPDTALTYILREASTLPADLPPQIDRLDGAYSRVHLSWLNHGLLPETLTRMFCLSAKTEARGAEALEEKLSAAREMVADGSLATVSKDFEEKLASWAAMGYPAIHHSETFRRAYRPAYRVIANSFAEYTFLFARIDRLLEAGPAVVVIEGGSANGKSTLGEALQTVYDCNLLHTDDFFLRPFQRTPERLAEIGGNLDRERFYEEIVQPLTRGEPLRYRPFNCMTQALEPPVTLEPKRLTVVEGAYSLHPFFGRYYDLSLFLDIPSDIQRERILKRNSPHFANRFFNEWIPMENAYFAETDIRRRADLIHTGF